MRRVSRKKSTFWNLVFSYSTILYGICSGLLLVPLYLEHIPIDLYGAWLASGNVLTWLTVIDPGISTVVTQRVGKSFGANKLEAVFLHGLKLLIQTRMPKSFKIILSWLC
jgi:hypothetical protein